MSVHSDISGIIAPFLFKKSPLNKVSVVVSSDTAKKALIIQKRDDGTYVVKVKKIKCYLYYSHHSDYKNPAETEGWLDYDDEYEVNNKRSLLEFKGSFKEQTTWKVRQFIDIMWIQDDIMERDLYDSNKIIINIFQDQKLLHRTKIGFSAIDYLDDDREPSTKTLVLNKICRTFSMFDILN